MKGIPVETVKVEVLRTLQSLTRESQFHVIFFNSKPEPQPVAGWLPGGQGVAQVLPWLRTISARGGTNPTPAFEMALRLSPRPDAIFFMTDGIIPPSVPGEVADLNKSGKRVPIHTIYFSAQVGRLAAAMQPAARPRTPGFKQVIALSAGKDAAAVQRASALLQQIALQSGGTFRAVAVPPNPPRAPWAR
jgi:hypothetical protein